MFLLQTEACEASSQRSDDSDSFATPPLSLNDGEAEYAHLEDEDDIDMEEDDEEEWKTVVPEVLNPFSYPDPYSFNN